MAAGQNNQDLDMLSKLIIEQLVSDGVARVDAMLAAGHILEQLQASHGGSSLYIPSQRQQREAEILRQWREGEKPQAIADNLDVDPSTVYRTINRKRQRADDQDDDTGFGSSEWAL